MIAQFLPLGQVMMWGGARFGRGSCAVQAEFNDQVDQVRWGLVKEKTKIIRASFERTA